MLLAAAALALVLLLLAVVVPPRLAAAAWPVRAPSYALVLWQALGFAGGVLAVEVAVTVALAPLGPSHAVAAAAALDGAPLPWWSVVALLVGAAVLGRLLLVLGRSAAATLRARHAHRVLVDLVATRNPLLAGTRVVDHDLPLAYCLPGLRPRVVLSRGVLALLREDEVRAVLSHETAHVDQRHDLVVLPFVALCQAFPRLRTVSTAQAQVALLVEMLADDRATREHPPAVLARALCKVGAARVPDGGVGAASSSDGVLTRASRLASPADPLPAAGRALVVMAAVMVLLVPVLGVVLPALA